MDRLLDSRPHLLVLCSANNLFFEAYLRGDHAAQAGITTVGDSGVTTEHFDTKPGSRTTITTLPSPKLHLRASATPTTNLTNCEMLMINEWVHPGKVVNILECNASDLHLNSSGACSFAYADILTPDPTGQGHVRLEIVEGGWGTASVTPRYPAASSWSRTKSHGTERARQDSDQLPP